VVRQVLLALAYMHSKGVAHRDIKPENVLCAISPNVGPYVVVSDLGLSGVMNNTKSRMKSDVGTAIYQAPYVQI
jgi:serine/threonine protein kinase